MNDAWVENLERQLAAQRLPAAPDALRGVVVAEMRRELAAARRDRWLSRAAGVLLAVGVGMNLSIGPPAGHSARTELARRPTVDSLVQVAATVAESTDGDTGRRFARQLAALAGWKLTTEQSAAIDAAVHLRPAADRSNHKEG